MGNGRHSAPCSIGPWCANSDQNYQNRQAVRGTQWRSGRSELFASAFRAHSHAQACSFFLSFPTTSSFCSWSCFFTTHLSSFVTRFSSPLACVVLSWCLVERSLRAMERLPQSKSGLDYVNGICLPSYFKCAFIQPPLSYPLLLYPLILHNQVSQPPILPCRPQGNRPFQCAR